MPRCLCLRQLSFIDVIPKHAVQTFSFLSSDQKKQQSQPRPSLRFRQRCVAMGLATQWLWREIYFLDRKLLARWVLFSEGDELGVSMTGYILLSAVFDDQNTSNN